MAISRSRKNAFWSLKMEKMDLAREIFQGTDVQITAAGTRHLGAALGSEAFKKVFIGEKVQEWVAQVKTISGFAKTQPHAAFAVFTKCLQARWTFVSRTIPGIGPLLTDLESEIRHSFIPAIFGGRDVSDFERDLLSLPARFGGMGIFNPSGKARESLKYSEELCAPLINLLLRQVEIFDPVSLTLK